MIEWPEPLFRIETHARFPRKEVLDARVPREVASVYTSGDLGKIEEVEKHNNESTVYVVRVRPRPAARGSPAHPSPDHPGSAHPSPGHPGSAHPSPGHPGSAHPSLVLRRTDASLARVVEAQCQLVTLADSPDLLSPRRIPETGRFTFLADGAVWFGYDEIPGELFDGRNRDPAVVIERGLDVLTRLGEAGERLGTQDLTITAHDPASWSRTLEPFLDRPSLENSTLIRRWMSDSTRSLLQESSDILQWADEAIEVWKRTCGPRVVHNDMQHANIIVHGPEVAFIDLEDICLEIPEIAMGHCVFKVLRAGVWCGAYPAGTVREKLLPEVRRKLRDAPGWSLKETDFFGIAAFRILSDLHKILSTYLDEGSDRYLFDLEKKVCNLFELAIFEGKYQG